MTDIERFTKISNNGLPDLDAALTWIVQTIEAEHFDLPNVELRSMRVLDADENSHYEAHVSGIVAPTSTDKDG